MFTLDETRKLLKNPKLHWVVKANAVRNHIDKYSFERAIYDLGQSKKTIQDYYTLSKYMNFFPLLKEIGDKRIALSVIKAHDGNSIHLRRNIALMAVRFKSKLLRSAMRTNVERI